jgi:hypothetical protein
VKILKDCEIITDHGEIIADVTLDEVQPDNTNITVGTTDDNEPVIYQPGRGWMDTTIADNSMFFGW